MDAGQGVSGCEGVLQLTGWRRSSRVFVLKRPLRGEVLLSDDHLNLAFIDTGGGLQKHAYPVLATSLPDEILTMAQRYRDRRDSENSFDELKSHWGWGGFTTHSSNFFFRV